MIGLNVEETSLAVDAVCEEMKRQAKLSSFLSPDGRSVHDVAPKQEAVTTNWNGPTVNGPTFKKRVLPSSIAKPSIGIGYNGYGGTIAAKTASGFRPPDRIGDPNFYGPTAAANDQAALLAREKRKTTAPVEDITLSVSQKRVLDTIIARKSVFFTGAAGTGKSHVLKIMREVLESLGLAEKVSFTAPTGVAACNIRGLTIHAWAGIGQSIFSTGTFIMV